MGKIFLDVYVQVGPVEGDPGASADRSIFPRAGLTLYTVSLACARNPFLVTRTDQHVRAMRSLSRWFSFLARRLLSRQDTRQDKGLAGTGLV
ncbi:MAG: hypothetical protein KatS3mg049_2483 [Caldilinea sp.]|nr:MAG: hypothetical protein KatS3mg049_2483 [Caldilinea sp.]